MMLPAGTGVPDGDSANLSLGDGAGRNIHDNRRFGLAGYAYGNRIG